MRKVANSNEKLPIYRCSRLTYINVDHGEDRVDASERDRGNSGFRGALIAKVFWYVRSWHLADIRMAPINVADPALAAFEPFVSFARASLSGSDEKAIKRKRDNEGNKGGR
jgi:hypothetical protein